MNEPGPGLMAAIAIAIVFVGIAWLLYGVTRAAADGAIKPNGGVGIRLPSLKRSESAWKRGHAAAAPIFLWFAVVATVFAAASVILSGSAWGYLAAVSVVVVSTLVGGGTGTVFAHLAASDGSR